MSPGDHLLISSCSVQPSEPSRKYSQQVKQWLGNSKCNIQCGRLCLYGVVVYCLEIFPFPPALIRMQLRRLIKNNAIYEKRSAHRRCCWYVHQEVLSRFGQEALPVPCQWTYLTTAAREEPREEPQAATGSQGNSPTTPQSCSTTPSSSNKRKSTGSMSITKFMKRCNDPEQVGKGGL